jgi:hypothetical protein
MSENFNSSILGDFQQSFESLCLRILHEGYEFMLATQKYQPTWDEESLTAHYYWCLKNLDLRRKQNVSIHCEVRQYDDPHFFEGFSAKSAPRIDLELSKWYSEEEPTFQVEAKILFENDKPLPSGRKARAVKGHERYIQTGIEHFLSGHYPLPGCLVSYVVEGATQQILSSINSLIVSNGLPLRVGIIQQDAEPRFPELYFSDNQSATGTTQLNHFMLKL